MIKFTFCEVSTLVLLCCNGCFGSDIDALYFSVENKCGDTIYVADYLCESHYYAYVRGAFMNDFTSYRLLPGETRTFPTWDKSVFTDGEGRTEQIFVIKQSTLNKYPQEVIFQKDTCDKRFVLTYDDLEAMNFKVVYDGK